MEVFTVFTLTFGGLPGIIRIKCNKSCWKITGKAVNRQRTRENSGISKCKVSSVDGPYDYDSDDDIFKCSRLHYFLKQAAHLIYNLNTQTHIRSYISEPGAMIFKLRQ